MARNKPRKTAKGSTGKNKNLSQDYMAKYGNKAGVLETNSGLMYRIIDDAEGASPTEFDKVKLHQRIWLADGSVIDDTYKSGFAEEFSVSEAIEGLQEGLQMMPLGARYEFVIPAELAWGRKGNGSKIGPNAVMIMDVRLLEIR
ncbi:FKBP-type peptidyl-prolyl cis-trans isomerase [Echinimonas agarilytica]|uniref:Peptidyl-prolyl cis-trans isomerase n=1 Tax=Echinimonas agarilytica TaxID=1215918 RepID=A0AA41W5D3_9GAMM|nr:FKBP-type peptidyl-prolyl cis-trans isomerase [Echinimonas agarilytica]MCM2679155.1 FKBP-type peptidyl-prolyl cis-trans isomerase [Echinimonas agarilytica]